MPFVLLSCYNTNMLLKRVLVGLISLLLTLPLMAGGRPWFRPVIKKVAPRTHLKTITLSRMERAAWASSRTAQFALTNREAYFKSAQAIPFQSMATLTAPVSQLPVAPDPLFALRNDKMALPWFETIEKDLLFLHKHKKEIKEVLKVQQAALQKINYASFIPETARKIFVGEEHYQPIIYEAFEKMIYQYQARFPDRKIIILTEFMSDRLFPWQKTGRPISRFEMGQRKNDSDFNFFDNFIKQGIEVVGLENVSYMKAHESLITPSESQAESVYGMQERNAHWRQIIEEVQARNPRAILFIYTGSLHSHYRAPFSLAAPSMQTFVMQWEVGFLDVDVPFGYVMRQEPFTKAKQDVSVLLWPKASAFSVRSGFDACFIFPKETTTL